MFINLISFVIAAFVYLFLWATGSNGLTASLIPALILLTGAAIYTYKPLIEKTIHREK